MLTEEPHEGGPSLWETPRSPWSGRAPESTLHSVASHVCSQLCHQLTQRDRKRQPVELVFPVRMLLNMLFITLPSGCPYDDVPREGILSCLVGERAVFLS